MNRLYMLGVALLVVALCCGCGDAGGEEFFCTTEARSSVVVRVVDTSATPLAAATVTYSVDGGPQRTAECLEPAGPCTVFVAGREISGVFAIRVEANGLQPASAAVAVERDRCHVITRDIAVVLAPL